MKKILFLALISIVFACSKEDPNTNYNDVYEKILGTWVFENYDSLGVTFIKTDDFEEDKRGFKFKRNQKMVVREGNNWCGTPPVQHENYAGKWKIIAQDTIFIENEYWGTNDKSGTLEKYAKTKLYITELSDKKLRFKYVH